MKCEWVGRGMWVRGGGLPSLWTFRPWNSSIETELVFFFIHLFQSLILFFFLPQHPQVLPNLRKSTGSLQWIHPDNSWKKSSYCVKIQSQRDDTEVAEAEVSRYCDRECLTLIPLDDWTEEFLIFFMIFFLLSLNYNSALLTLNKIISTVMELSIQRLKTASIINEWGYNTAEK